MQQLTPTTPLTASAPTQATDLFDTLRQRVHELWHKARQAPLCPLAIYQFEQDLKASLDEAGRTFLEQQFNQLEPRDKEQAPPRVRYHKATYRINKPTKATIATAFGPITLWSFLYLNDEPGEAGLHPLHVQLGIVAGATPVLCERVARWAVDHSQSQVRQLLLDEHGLKWSNDKLRSALREYRRLLAPFREELQAERLLGWLQQAECSRGRHRPVLAIGRDGIMMPIRGCVRCQEAAAGTLSVYDRRGKRLGTVYLGQMPETKQVTMTADLTGLAKEVLKRYPGPTPRLVYVTDKGQAQDEYYKRVLRKMRHPRQPRQHLEWEWVLDFFHVCGYVGQLSEALFGKATKEGRRWFGRMRDWLVGRHQGVSQILRSATQHYNGGKLSKAAEEEFWKAYGYLRRHGRWMDYGRYRRQGLPIGSGVTEAACKTVFAQRFKRSGMRWGKESGQVIVDLRVMYLSGIWSAAVRKELLSRQLPQPLKRASDRPPRRQNRKKAA
jgi:hypothetical protein